jgi:hypothetical protein
MPSTKMTGVIVREWLSHNDNDPVHYLGRNTTVGTLLTPERMPVIDFR